MSALDGSGGNKGEFKMTRIIPVAEIQIGLPSTREEKKLGTVAELAQCLLYDFPSKGRGDEYMTALMVCLECLEGGDSSPEDARAAFVMAAHEVDLLVLPNDGPDI
jgi:hypothetical protein